MDSRPGQSQTPSRDPPAARQHTPPRRQGDIDMSDETSGLTRRDVIKVGTAASLAGYAVGVEKVLAQAIKTDTAGITAGDAEVAIGSYNMPVYEARPASGGPAPIVVCISGVLGRAEGGATL